jgi:hypothetical protein
MIVQPLIDPEAAVRNSARSAGMVVAVAIGERVTGQAHATPPVTVEARLERVSRISNQVRANQEAADGYLTWRC